jgi:hypothetical protein
MEAIDTTSHDIHTSRDEQPDQDDAAEALARIEPDLAAVDPQTYVRMNVDVPRAIRIEHKTPVTREEVDRAAVVGTKLLKALGADGAAVMPAKAAERRVRAFTSSSAPTKKHAGR